MYSDCMGWCGISQFNCKNTACSASPCYIPPKKKNKKRQGGGLPSTKVKSTIRKNNSKGFDYNDFFLDKDEY